MPISFNRYVNITSGVGGGAAVRRRDLVARLFHTNPLTPTGTVLEFRSATEVGNYYGTDTEEFRRANYYFGFVSKIITRPQSMSFSRWANADTAPQIFGSTQHSTVDQLNAITAGNFMLEIGGVTLNVDNLDFSGDSSFSDVASALQTEIRTGTGTAFTGATVTYDATRGSFNLTSGATGDATISVTVGSSNDAAAAIGWTTGAVLSEGAAAETVTDVLSMTTQFNNNFGSFTFISTLTMDQVVEAANWNRTQNVLFQYHVQVTPANAAAMSAALINIGGSSMTLNLPNLTNEYPEMLPMSILAATDYTRRASTQNYMFYESTLTPTVTTDSAANLYDRLRVNYYGETQTAGQLRRFYQRGVMNGISTDPTDQNTYGNEQWLKDDAGANIMSLLLSLPKVSANQRGRGQLLSIVQSTIDQALLNGTISVGRTLTPQQRIFINERTGNERSFQQVQNSGYWVNVQIASFTTQDGRTEFRGEYTLIYTKDDVVRMVEGTHTLI